MSEINYNDGLWHGWTGGECPVHEKSEIIVKWSCNGVEARNRARGFSKQHWHDASICAFRVTEPYVEPREFWVNPDKCIATPFYHAGFILVREVLE